jgi:hypothetical protein
VVCAEWKPTKFPSDLCIDARNHPSPGDWDAHVTAIKNSAMWVCEHDLVEGKPSFDLTLKTARGRAHLCLSNRCRRVRFDPFFCTRARAFLHPETMLQVTKFKLGLDMVFPSKPPKLVSL